MGFLGPVLWGVPMQREPHCYPYLPCSSPQDGGHFSNPNISRGKVLGVDERQFPKFPQLPTGL